jgi:Tfp pilus assembly protein PilZ
MIEKRRYKRIVIQNMDITASTLFSTEVDVYDISPTGIAVTGTARLAIGRTYTLRLGVRGEGLSIKGTVRWERLTGSRKGGNDQVIPLYMAGIEFTDIFTEKGERLVKFLREISGTEHERLKGVRFKVLDNEKAVLDCVETYFVSVIGAGGALIETPLEFSVGSILPMELTFPDDERPIRFTGRVASCLPASQDNADRRKVGIEFRDMSEADRDRLLCFIAELSV